MLTLVQNGRVVGGAYVLPRVWENAIAGWLTWLKLGGLSGGTVRLRRDHVRTVAHRSGTAHPRQLTVATLVGVCDRPWSKEHRKAVRASLVSFCDWCVVNGVMDHNPAAQLPRVVPPTPKPRPAPDSVWRELMERAAPRERLMARLAGEAGLRRAEVACAHRDDLLRDGCDWALLVHGKGGRQRCVPITASLAAEIQRWCQRGYLFPNGTGGHITAQYVGTLISGLMPPGWTMHKLRHRFATRGYAGTHNLRAVQEALGHVSVATTQRYTAVSSREVRLVSEAASGGGGDDVA